MEKQSIGENVRTVRRRLNLSQEELAASVGCTRQTVINWETGKARPSRYGIARLAKSLGVSTDELVKE